VNKLFSELGLSAGVLQAVEKLGFEQASPIQAAAIPELMAGKDIVGQSQTGSGKTAAFGIPAVEKVDPAKRQVQVLILCPTRELAVQVSEEIYKLALFKPGIRALPIYGGQSYERQFAGLRQGAQVVIGTPGRIMDHMRRGTLRLDTVRMAILDEADVMLNMGFRDDIELILQAAPKDRQTVFFSATMPKPIRDLIAKYSRDAQNVKIEQKVLTVPTVDQVYFEVDNRHKMELLTRLIDLHDLKLGIIFCNTKRMVDDLVDYLAAAGYQADRLHGDMNQNMRDRVMNKFRQSGLEFLVATDVAARGIDVDDVEVVFNYDLPYDPEDYVHRIGRTGRAGKSGRAISLLPYRELFQIKNIERFTNQRIQRGTIPTVDEVAEAKENVFLEKLRSLLTGGAYQKRDQMIERLLEEGFNSLDIASALIHLLQSGESAKSTRKTPDPRGPRREMDGERPRKFQATPSAPVRRPEEFERRDRPPVPTTPAPSAPQPVKKPIESPRPLPEKAYSDSKFQATTSAPVRRPEKFEKRDRPSVPPAPAPTAPQPVKKPIEAPNPLSEKTYSDSEILASVKRPEPKPESKLISKPKPATEVVKPKASRSTPEGQTRLWMNLGQAQGITPIDVVNSVAGETGLPGKVVGTVDVRENHLFADVANEHVQGIIAKLNRTTIKGRKVKVKLA